MQYMVPMNKNADPKRQMSLLEQDIAAEINILNNIQLPMVLYL